MPIFLNPFQKHDVSEFEGVHVPLASAERHPSLIGSQGEKSNFDPEVANESVTEVGAQTSQPPKRYTIQDLRVEIDTGMLYEITPVVGRGGAKMTDVAASGHDTVYDRKSIVINKAIQDIGMGPYQWQLFVLCGFGWLADNLWLQGLALVLPSLTLEFGPSPTQVRYTTCAAFVGLCIGAVFWGIASDVVGRRLAFNATLFLAGVFGLAVGAGNTWIGTCGLFASLAVGIGGNLPVDGALFLEFLPFASRGLLTLLSIWWPVGQLIASLIAWPLIPPNTCDKSLESCNITAPGIACCHKDQNMGWRYFMFTLGALTFSMFICRFFLFHLYESPKFLLSRGRQAEAVACVYGIAYKNGRKTWLTEEILNELGGGDVATADRGLSRKEVVRRVFAKFSTERIAPLFITPKLGAMTCLVWFCWATIGMGYPLFNAFLPQYLQNVGGETETPTNISYRNYAITSIVGVPGSIVAYYTVDIQYIGRKYTIAVSTLLTGILLFLFAISSDPSYQVAMSSLVAFFQNIMYGVLYAYTPEIFPAPSRGTGTGIASFFNRIAGLLAPIVAIHAGGVNPKAPIYASGALMLAAFLAMCCFPIETRGKQSL